MRDAEVSAKSKECELYSSTRDTDDVRPARQSDAEEEPSTRDDQVSAEGNKEEKTESDIDYGGDDNEDEDLDGEDVPEAAISELESEEKVKVEGEVWELQKVASRDVRVPPPHPDWR